MVDVNRELILKLESLARLELSEEERNAIQKDLESILEMIERMDEVQTKGIEPLVHILQEGNSTRKDEVTGELTNDQALSNAPEAKPPLFSVPKVINRS